MELNKQSNANEKKRTEGFKSKIKIIVCDIIGNEVVVSVDANKSAGNYEIQFDATNISSGVYYYQLVAGDFIKTKKMILLK